MLSTLCFICPFFALNDYVFPICLTVITIRWYNKSETYPTFLTLNCDNKGDIDIFANDYMGDTQRKSYLTSLKMKGDEILPQAFPE